MHEPRVVVVDDEEIVRDLFRDICSREGFQVVSAPDGRTGIRAVGEMPAQVVVTDLKLPGMDGLELMERIARIDPKIVTIVMTGHGTIDEAVRAMKRGAFDFITKPFRSDAVRAILRTAVEYQRLRQEHHLLRLTGRDRSRFPGGAGPWPFRQPPASVELGEAGIDLVNELEQYETHLITVALRRANGITSRAARLLHLNRTTLVEKLKRKKLDARLLVAGPSRP